MPVPERYAKEIPRMAEVWESAGYFRAQARIWEAQSEARHELYGDPSEEGLGQIRRALSITPEDLVGLNNAKGHETNKLLRLFQSRLTPEVGNVLHRGNTSSDVLDTSLALQAIESIDLLEEDFCGLSDSLKALSLKHKDTLQVARTHGQHAMPHTFGRQVLGWYVETERGLDRLERARNVIAYGKLSGEVGTNVFIDPELEEKSLTKLGLKTDAAPTQIISRDRHAEVVGLMGVNSGTLARIATNVRLLAMTDVREVREPFDEVSQQGSSSMPQKRNPELAERVVGINREIRSGVLEEMDAQISWLERDISHSSTERFVFPDVFGGLAYATKITREIIDGLVVNSDRMFENLNSSYGAIYGNRLLNTLLDTGKISRTEGYELVKGLAQGAMDQRVQLQELASKNPTISELISVDELPKLFDPQFYLRNIDVAYKRAGIIK